MTLLLLVFSSADAGKMTREQKAYAAADAQAVTLIDAQRSAAEAKGDGGTLLIWLATLNGQAATGIVERGTLTWESHGAPAVAAAEAMAGKDAALGPDLLAAGARVHLAFGHVPEAGAMAERAVLLRQTQDGMDLVLAWRAQASPAGAVDTCKAARKAAKSDIQRYIVLDRCFVASGASDVATGLAWASADDRSYYDKELVKKQQRADARAAAQKAQMDAMKAEWAAADARAEAARAASAGSAPASGGASTTSISAHITCSSKVRVFRGSSGGSGTYGWEEPNHTVSWSLPAGEQICVCDASDKRLSCWSPSGQPRVEVDIGCGGVSAR